MDLPKLDFLNPASIPIPDATHLTKIAKRPLNKGEDRPLRKYEKEYESYCRWSALPEEERNPKTQATFEKKYGLPKSYATSFQEREDFQTKRLTYFWNWMMDKLPNVVYAMYKKAIDIKRSDTNAAKFFGELIAKHMDIDKPKQVIQPFMLVGVPQDKIDKLFTPKSYEDADLVPKT